MKSQTLSQEDLELIERFKAAYNDIEKHLRKDLKHKDGVGFQQLITWYSEKHRRWGSEKELKLYAGLRNVLTHDRIAAFGYPCVPRPEAVARIEAIRDILIHPQLVIPRFQKEVSVVTHNRSLAAILLIIHQQDFSQFPVYDTAGKYTGLLTENGITRWLAHHVSSKMSLVEMEDILVSEVMASEEKRDNWAFASRETLASDVIGLFADNPLLEAVIITHSGSQSEKPIGIATRWDVLTQDPT